jgi:hypothetical protein
MKAIIRPFLPPRPADAPAEPELWRPGVLEEVAAQAGLTPESTFVTSWSYEYRGEDALGRAMLAPAGIAAIVGPSREQALRDAILDELAPYRADDGAYRLRNEYRGLVARA